MWTTKSLKPAVERGVETIKKADEALRAVLCVSAAILVVCLCTLAAVLASRPAHA